MIQYSPRGKNGGWRAVLCGWVVSNGEVWSFFCLPTGSCFWPKQSVKRKINFVWPYGCTKLPVHNSGGPLTTSLHRCGDPIPTSSGAHFYVHTFGHQAAAMHIGMVANISNKDKTSSFCYFTDSAHRSLSQLWRACDSSTLHTSTSVPIILKVLIFWELAIVWFGIYNIQGCNHCKDCYSEGKSSLFWSIILDSELRLLACSTSIGSY